MSAMSSGGWGGVLTIFIMSAVTVTETVSGRSELYGSPGIMSAVTVNETVGRPSELYVSHGCQYRTRCVQLHSNTSETLQGHILLCHFSFGQDN